MNNKEKQIPCWKAPETLICRVLDAIDKKQCACRFFAWPLMYRIIFCTAAVAVIIFGVLLSSQIVVLSDIVNLIQWKINVLFEIYNKVLIAHDILHSIAERLLWRPALSAGIALLGVVLLSAWAASIAVLYRLMRSHVRRRLI